MFEMLTVRLGKALAVALEREADQTGVSKGEIMRQALAARLRPGGGPLVMRQYFGVTRGPADLSTNRAYRRSWRRKRG